MTTQHHTNDDRAAHPAVHRRRRWHRYASIGLLTLTGCGSGGRSHHAPDRDRRRIKPGHETLDHPGVLKPGRRRINSVNGNIDHRCPTLQCFTVNRSPEVCTLIP